MKDSITLVKMVVRLEMIGIKRLSVKKLRYLGSLIRQKRLNMYVAIVSEIIFSSTLVFVRCLEAIFLVGKCSISGVITVMVLIMMLQVIIAVSADTLSLLVKSRAISIVKISGMFVKTESFVFVIICDITAGSQLKFAESTFSRIFAIGSTDIGSISDLSIFCRLVNVFLNIIESVFEYGCFFYVFTRGKGGEFRRVQGI